MLIVATDKHFLDLVAGAAPNGFKMAPGGIESPEILQMLRELAASVSAHFAPAAWLIVEHNEVVGMCSVKAAPSADAAVDIGYGIAETRRGRGCAGRAVANVIAWARADTRINILTAETSIDNIPSQCVLKRNGFVHTGNRMDDEDGMLMCWHVYVG